MSGNHCKFNEDCAYTHSKINHYEEKNNLKEKVEILEKTVIDLNKKVESKELERCEKVLHALTRKVLYLENEMKELKNKKENIKDVMNENHDKTESSFNHNDIKHSSSTPKIVKDKPIEQVQIISKNIEEGLEEQSKEVMQVKTDKDPSEKEEKLSAEKESSKKKKKKTVKELYMCEDCDYTCLKFTTLSKHKNTKHIGHTCKVCSKNFTNPKDLQQHVAIEHNEEDAIINNMLDNDKEKVNAGVDGKKESEIHKESSFEWKESMLDEFL